MPRSYLNPGFLKENKIDSVTILSILCGSAWVRHFAFTSHFVTRVGEFSENVRILLSAEFCNKWKQRYFFSLLFNGCSKVTEEMRSKFLPQMKYFPSTIFITLPPPNLHPSAWDWERGCHGTCAWCLRENFIVTQCYSLEWVVLYASFDPATSFWIWPTSRYCKRWTRTIRRRELLASFIWPHKEAANAKSWKDSDVTRRE